MLFKSVWFAYVKYNPVILLWLVIVKSIVLTSDVFVIVSNEFVKLLSLFVMIEIKLVKFDAFVISNRNWLSVKFCCLNNSNWFFKETTVLIVFV